MLGKIREKMKNKKGFTMVELIVVIVIILILAAALVPQLLKYVDTANRANCQSEAATLLSQLQADWVASQASDQTGVKKANDGSFTVQTVTIKKATAKVTDATLTGKGEAYYFDEAITGDAGSDYSEITSFGYCDGKYKAVWTADDGWKLTKAPAASN